MKKKTNSNNIYTPRFSRIYYVFEMSSLAVPPATVQYSTVFDELKKIQNQQQFPAIQCRLSMCVCVCLRACILYLTYGYGNDDRGP